MNIFLVKVIGKEFRSRNQIFGVSPDVVPNPFTFRQEGNLNISAENQLCVILGRINTFFPGLVDQIKPPFLWNKRFCLCSQTVWQTVYLSLPVDFDAITTTVFRISGFELLVSLWGQITPEKKRIVKKIQNASSMIANVHSWSGTTRIKTLKTLISQKMSTLLTKIRTRLEPPKKKFSVRRRRSLYSIIKFNIRKKG